ncbi:CYP4V2 [Cordylochernes scorpioides]|uniref:CYP4V2 n=1 Tax=Cordylochernes scorpioides TaxID=51811 RepID=A0ABY6LDM1_9ARAC|nr:CYP4V2 [Cordylochernes scorpioides]
MTFIYMIHRSPDIYPNPEVFDPDRFLPENYLCKFRVCTGQKFAFAEQKVVLATILRRFKITSLIQRDKVHVVPELVLTAKPGLFMKFERRHCDLNNNLDLEPSKNSHMISNSIKESE